MKIKVFDFEHEEDLEKAVNSFIESNKSKILDVKYQTSHFSCNGEQIYSFSCLMMYE